MGTDVATQNKGVLRTTGELDLHPQVMLDQIRRSAENYAGKRSPKATQELIDMIAYKTDDGAYLRIDSKEARRLAPRIAYINKSKLEAAQRALDELPDGQWLHPDKVGSIFRDSLDDVPKSQHGDYVAVHKDAKEVWTEMMGPSPNKFARYWDTGLTYWKGLLLALAPRWYLNNTVGLALQYGLLAGADIWSIRMATKSRVRQSMQTRAAHVARDTLANEAQGSVRVNKAIRFGFSVNSKLEELWRRAAYANRAKRLLGNEGVRVRKLSDEDFARALENMPDASIRQIVRDVDFFIGDFRKFSNIEKTIVKRVIPFYSWFRVISRLTFALPFHSPLRAYAQATLGRAATAGIDPYAPLRPWYARPAWTFGDVQFGLTSATPGMTVGGWIHAVGSGDPAPALLSELEQVMHPFINLAITWPTGLDSFGNKIQALPGEAAYGRDPQEINASSGLVESTRSYRGPADALLDLATPGQKNLIRKIAGGNRTVRNGVDTHKVVMDWFSRLQGGKRDESLYYGKSKNDPPAVKFAFSPALSALFSVNIVRQNPQALARKAQKELDDYVRQQRKLDLAKKKAKSGR